MRELALGKAPRALEVLGEIFGLLDGSDDGRVNSLLVGNLGRSERLLSLGLALLKELLLGRAGTLSGSLSKVRIVDLLVNLQDMRCVSFNIGIRQPTETEETSIFVDVAMT